MTETLLRSAGDFPNKSAVEYATILIDVQEDKVPVNLLPEGHSGCLADGPGYVGHFYPSPTGRLMNKELFLDSVELAERFCDWLRAAFTGRPYADGYRMAVEVRTTTSKVTATKGRMKHSAAVRELLRGADIK